MKLNKRGNVDMAISWVYGLVVIGFLVGAGLLALGTFRDSMTALSAEANATGNVIGAIGNFATQLGTVGTMIGIALLIAVVFGALAYIAIRRE
jgi:hypothetical protein